MSTLDATRLIEFVAPLARVLNREFEIALVDVDVACSKGNLDLPAHPYGTARTHLTRARARRRLESATDLEGWTLSHSSGPNTPIHLHKGESSVRVLHTWDEKVVPSSGKNRARRAFYCNTPFENLGGQEVLFAQEKYLILWRVDVQGQLNLRLIHPVGDWKYGSIAKYDLAIDLIADADEYSKLVFVAADDDDANEFRLPNEQEGEEVGAADISS
ncbi:hypothetical protein [Cryobacterium sp. Y62]|uniref:hypothetical protein n=1 Tax=Cryobacterium sp. Y62 TaxID=2048284 RepID=UPI0011AFE738|nr:hypothetical protein [Cryobacterium sp. Y62]